MTTHRLKIDLSTGEVTEEALTPEEETEREAMQTAAQAEADKFNRRQTRLAQIKANALPATVKTKLKDGVALTAGETQLILRWLVFDSILDDLVD